MTREGRARMTLKPPPDIYGSVLVIGGGSATSDGPPVAKVGGFWGEQNLGLSYGSITSATIG